MARPRHFTISLRWLGLLVAVPLLAGSKCGPVLDDTGTEDVRNAVEFDFELEYADADTEEAHVLDRVSLVVSDVVFEADGPEEHVSISNATTASVEVVTGAGMSNVPFIELPVGTYTAVEASVILDSQSGSALVAEGSIGDHVYRLEIAGPLTLVGGTDTLILPSGPDLDVTVWLRPDTWIEDLDFEQLGEEEGVVVISPTENVESYAAVRAHILESTTLSFPGSETDAEDR